MTHLPDTFYRRRLLDGRHYIFHTHGFGRRIQDTADVLVFDWRHNSPHLMADVAGWGAGTPRSRLFAPDQIRAYGRSFWWRSRPLNIAQQFNQDGGLIVTRVDFATPAVTTASGTYQTDLYLDCFIAPDNETFLIEDEDEVEAASQRGLISPAQRATIEAALEEVVELLRERRWAGWLDAVAGAPFDHRLLPTPRNHDSQWLVANHYPWPEERDA
ncbi:MAG TPA: hypothetical protein VGE07_09445 [Herpetosiphonaceae bacterium]